MTPSITLSGTTPQIVPLATGQTPAQLIASLYARRDSGDIAGDQSAHNGLKVINVFDNADYGLASLNGVEMPLGTEIFVAQTIPGDCDLDGEITSNEISVLKQILAAGVTPTNAPNGFYGSITGAPGLGSVDANFLFLAISKALG